MIESGGNTDDYARHQVEYLWSEIVGQVINRETLRRFVEKDILHVFMANGPIKSELAFMAPSLVDKINEVMGRHIISKIKIH